MVISQDDVETVGYQNYGYNPFDKPPRLMGKQNKSKMVDGSVNNFQSYHVIIAQVRFLVVF